MESLFTDEECKKWQKHFNIQQQCCDAPEYVSFFKQDRAIDEMPTLYKKCKNCRRVIKVK